MGGTLFDHIHGLYLTLTGLNYVPLALHAVALSRPGALDRELAGVDTGQEIRRYGVLQVWILVPLALVLMASRQAFAGRPS